MAAPRSPGTEVVIYWLDRNGPKDKVFMQPDDTLQYVIDHARRVWNIADDLQVCLYNQNRILVGDLDRTFQSSNLGRCMLIVDYSQESRQLATQRKDKEAAVAYKRNLAEHEKWRETANPVDAFRYDLKRHAQTLEHVMKHADDKQLHRLFNTHGILRIHNMLVGAFQVDPATETQAVNRKEFEQFGRCPDGNPFCSAATRAKLLNHLETNVFVGDVPKYVAPAAQGGGVSSVSAQGGGGKSPPLPSHQSPQQAQTSQPSPQPGGGSDVSTTPAKKIAGSPPSPPPQPPAFELTTETLGIGEIIRPRLNRRQAALPKVEKKQQIASFTNVDLKYGAVEDFSCECEIYIDDADGAEAPQIRYKSQSKEKIINLRWRSKQVLSQPLAPGSTSFSVVLELDDFDLQAQFGSDTDVLAFERAINHVYRHLHAFAPGAGRRFDDFDFTEKQMAL